MIKEKDKVNIHGIQRKAILKNGKMIKCMEKEFLLIKMESNLMYKWKMG